MDLCTYRFHQVWKLSSHYFLRYLLCLSPSLSCLKLPHRSMPLYSIIFCLFILVFHLDSFYCYIFKFTNLFAAISNLQVNSIHLLSLLRNCGFLGQEFDLNFVSYKSLLNFFNLWNTMMTTIFSSLPTNSA